MRTATATAADLTAAARDLAALDREIGTLERRAAAIDPDLFNELVLRDEAGLAVDIAPLHRAWTAHVSWAWARGLFPVVLAPWGHGKTVVMIVGRILWEIGRKPAIRVKLVCNDDTTAKERVRLIGRYLASDEYRAVFPRVRPAQRVGRGAGEPWSAHALQVAGARGARAVDPTVAAHGVLSTGIGGRCDLLVGDDVVDYRNAVVMAAQRPVIRETWERVWESRRESAGRSLYIGTPWHQHDLTAALEARTGTAVLRAAVNEEVSALELSVRVVGGDVPDDYPAPDDGRRGADGRVLWSLPLWEKRWPRAALLEDRAARPRAFRQGRQLAVYEEGELTFPSWRKCWRDATADELGARSVIAVGGVDLSGVGRRGTAVAIVGLDARERRMLLDIRLGRWTSPQTAEVMGTLDARWRPADWLVESNAYQIALVDWLRSAEGRFDFARRVRPFVTGANKMNSDVGLPALEVEFAGGQWDIPAREFAGHVAGCECGWCELNRQMSEHPQAEQFDCGMAVWFCGHHLRTGRGAPLAALKALNDDAREANVEALRKDWSWQF